MRNKGQVSQQISLLVVTGILLAISLIIIGNVEHSTVGECVSDTATVNNGTDLNGGGSHIFTLSNLVTKYSGTLDVAYEFGTSCNLTANGHSIGSLDGTSPDQISISGSYLSTTTNITYTCDAATNITDANLTYHRLVNCSVDIDTYETISNTNETTYDVYGLLRVVLIVLAAVVIISTLFVLGRRR